MNQRVFISRHPEQVALLRELLEQRGIVLSSHSLIHRENIRFDLPVPQTDWLFFSSPYAVEAFYSQGGRSDAKIAAVGPGTAQSLAPFGEIHFKGIGTNTEQTGKTFSELAKGETILFPMAEESLKTVQKYIDPEYCSEIICYRSVEVPVSVEPADLYFLTSPSNVKSFFRVNTVSYRAWFLCPGESTAKTLREFGIQKIQICSDFEPLQLENAIISILGS